MEREEPYRNRWALGLTVSLSLVIFTSFAFYKGYLSVGSPKIAGESKSQTANVISAEKVPSPIESSASTFKSALYEIDRQYQSFKASISDVLVPFVTGIDVYERQ